MEDAIPSKKNKFGKNAKLKQCSGRRIRTAPDWNDPPIPLKRCKSWKKSSLAGLQSAFTLCRRASAGALSFATGFSRWLKSKKFVSRLQPGLFL